MKSADYKEIKLLGGANVFVDFSSRHTKCRKCNSQIRFGITKNGKYIPIIEIRPNEWQAHFADCKFADDFRGRGSLNNRIQEEERTQQLLNEM